MASRYVFTTFFKDIPGRSEVKCILRKLTPYTADLVPLPSTKGTIREAPSSTATPAAHRPTTTEPVALVPGKPTATVTIPIAQLEAVAVV